VGIRITDNPCIWTIPIIFAGTTFKAVAHFLKGMTKSVIATVQIRFAFGSITGTIETMKVVCAMFILNAIYTFAKTNAVAQAKPFSKTIIVSFAFMLANIINAVKAGITVRFFQTLHTFSQIKLTKRHLHRTVITAFASMVYLDTNIFLALFIRFTVCTVHTLLTISSIVVAVWPVGTVPTMSIYPAFLQT